MKRNAFSLVELSIVLVILGLLVGGVLSGQALIRAAELRAITSEFSRYAAAVQTFRDKYFAIPGDFNNAQAFWGQSTACGGASATGTCNGNGDGAVSTASVPVSTSGERFQFWRQLALAGLIEGNYTGVATATATGDIIGTTSPKSRVTNAGWSSLTRNNYVGDGAYYALDYGDMFAVGAQDTTDITRVPILKPEEAWNIDTKMDDGIPTSGRVIGTWFNSNGCTTKPDGTAAAQTDTAGIYQLSYTGIVCSLAFIKAY